jgi:hypothetical protein
MPVPKEGIERRHNKGDSEGGQQEAAFPHAIPPTSLQPKIISAGNDWGWKVSITNAISRRLSNPLVSVLGLL